MSSLAIRRPQVLLGLLAVLGALSACQRGPDSPQGAAAVPVSVVTLKPESVTLTRELPGRSTAYLVAEVRPQVDGIVDKRLFTEGGLVKAGQPLYQLDDATYRADRDSAQANARARAGDARHGATQRQAQRAARARSMPSASRTTRTPPPRCAQAEADAQGGRRPPRTAPSVDPRLRAHHLADQRPHRQVDRSRRARSSPRTRTSRSPPCSSSTRSTSTSPSRAPSCCSCASELARGHAARARRDLPVTILLEDGTALRARRQARVLRRHASIRRTGSFGAARRRAEPRPPAAARHVRARGGRRRRARQNGAARAAAGRRARPEGQHDGDGRRAATARSRCARSA